MQHVRAGGEDHEEDDERVGDERVAGRAQQPGVAEAEERRVAEAQRAALRHRLRDAAHEEHAAERVNAANASFQKRFLPFTAVLPALPAKSVSMSLSRDTGIPRGEVSGRTPSMSRLA